MLIAAGGGGRDVWAGHGLVPRQSRRSRTRVRAWLVTVGTVGQGTYPEGEAPGWPVEKDLFQGHGPTTVVITRLALAWPRALGI
jgi:hypothetical protein